MIKGIQDMSAEQCRQWADSLQAELHGHFGRIPKARRQEAEAELESVYARWKEH